MICRKKQWIDLIMMLDWLLVVVNVVFFFFVCQNSFFVFKLSRTTVVSLFVGSTNVMFVAAGAASANGNYILFVVIIKFTCEVIGISLQLSNDALLCSSELTFWLADAVSKNNSVVIVTKHIFH
jgi:hypothetical protein